MADERLPLPLKAHRFNRDMTQQKLSKLTRGKVSQEMISEIERGTKNPSDTTRVRIAKALGVDVAEIAF